MRAVIQRVSEAKVTVNDRIVGAIGRGLLILLGVEEGDKEEDSTVCAEKIVNLRIFPDEAGKMNLSVKDLGGELLVVSQFTLLADISKGRRPSFVRAAKPDHARYLYEDFIQKCIQSGLKVEQGQFGAMMKVHLVNDGPVTLIFDTRSEQNHG